MAFRSTRPSTGDKPKGTPPALTVRASGGLKASCWQNEHKGNDGLPFVTFNTTLARGWYDDEKKEWKDTDSLRESDLLAAAELLRQVWTQIQEAKTAREDHQGGSGNTRNAQDGSSSLPPY